MPADDLAPARTSAGSVITKFRLLIYTVAVLYIYGTCTWWSLFLHTSKDHTVLDHQQTQCWLKSYTCFLQILPDYQWFPTTLINWIISFKMVWETWSTLTVFNTLRPRQNGRHFPDDFCKWIFLNENVWISIKISPKFVPKGAVNNIPALVLIVAWRRTGDKPLSEPMMVRSSMHVCFTRPQWVKD